jgi:Protein of unknown function (DUF3606)
VRPKRAGGASQRVRTPCTKRARDEVGPPQLWPLTSTQRSEPFTAECAFRSGTKVEETMAAKKKSARGRRQDRARVAGGQSYEVGYEAKKSRTSRAAVKKAVKKVGNSREKVERRLGR